MLSTLIGEHQVCIGGISFKEEGSNMDQSVLTYVLLGMLVISLAASYVRYRRHGDDAPASSVDIRQTMAETRDLLGLAPKGKEGGLADVFDLTPMQMLTDASSSAKGAAQACGKRGERRKGEKRR